MSATFEQALGHLQSGRLREAEAIYREILKADPENVDALHLLGVAVFQAGRGDEAAGFIERSLHQNPGNADALNNLGQVYEFLNRTDDAIDAYMELKWEEVYNFEHTPHPVEWQMYYSA